MNYSRHTSDQQLADRLRAISEERNQVIGELEKRGYKLTAKLTSGANVGFDSHVVQSEKIKVVKTETISL